MRRKLARRFLEAAAWLLLLVVSLGLVSYARWLYRIAEGNRALAAADIAQARQAYAAAAQHLEGFGALRALLPSGYRQLIFNRARALYAAGEDEELARMLDTEAARAPFLAEESEYHYWMGNVQCRRALAQKDKQALQVGLQQAGESYRRALAASPNDWDSKFNYELVTHVLENMRKGKEDSLERLKRGQVKLLRENIEKSRNQQNQLAPEKRG